METTTKVQAQAQLTSAKITFEEIKYWEEKFQFVRELGSGSYGTVWAVVALGDKTKTIKALKIITKNGGFVPEMDALCSLAGKSGILPIEKFYFCEFGSKFKNNQEGTRGDEIGLLMPVGVKFSSWWEERVKCHETPLDLISDLCMTGFYMLNGLSSLHSEGFMHLDMKTSNWIVIKDKPYVIDFGLSKRMIQKRDALNDKYIWDDNENYVSFYRSPELFHSKFFHPEDATVEDAVRSDLFETTTIENYDMDVEKERKILEPQWEEANTKIRKKKISEELIPDIPPPPKALPKPLAKKPVMVSKFQINAQKKADDAKKEIEKKLNVIDRRPILRFDECYDQVYNEKYGQKSETVPRKLEKQRTESDDGVEEQEESHRKSKHSETSTSSSSSSSDVWRKERKMLFGEDALGQVHFYNQKADIWAVGQILLRLMFMNYAWSKNILQQLWEHNHHVYNYTGKFVFDDWDERFQKLSDSQKKSFNIFDKMLKFKNECEPRYKKQMTSAEKKEFGQKFQIFFYILWNMLNPNPDKRSNAQQLLEKIFTKKTFLPSKTDPIFGKFERLPLWTDYPNRLESRTIKSTMSKNLATSVRTTLTQFREYYHEFLGLSSRVYYFAIYLWWYTFLSTPAAASNGKNSKAYLIVCFEIACDMFDEQFSYVEDLPEMEGFSESQVPSASFKGLKSKIITYLEGRIWFPSFFCTWEKKLEEYNEKRETLLTDYIKKSVFESQRFPTLIALEQVYLTWYNDVKSKSKKYTDHQ